MSIWVSIFISVGKNGETGNDMNDTMDGDLMPDGYFSEARGEGSKIKLPSLLAYGDAPAPGEIVEVYKQRILQPDTLEKITSFMIAPSDMVAERAIRNSRVHREKITSVKFDKSKENNRVTVYYM
jgi:hypothetical protein